MIPRDITPLVDQIFESDRSEIEKISAAFHLITGFHIKHSKNECELLRATGDRESLVKEQIKHSTMTHMLSVYNDCFYRATGSHWQEEKTDE